MGQRLRSTALFALGAASCAGVIGLDDYRFDDGALDGSAPEASQVNETDANTCLGTLRGRIFDPRGINAVPNTIVYVPTSAPAKFPEAAARSCESCTSLMSGSPSTSAVTQPDGTFVLPNVPAGVSFPLVILNGHWRRQVTIDAIPACGGEATLPAALATLPKNHLEGDLPKIAMTTGIGDLQHCFLRRLGIDESEFTSATGPGRVHFYVQNGATADGGTLTAAALWDDPARLATYDLLMAGCDNGHGVPAGGPTPTGPPPIVTASQLANVKAYVDNGGRLFATHWLASDFVDHAWLPPSAPAVWEYGAIVDADRGPPDMPYTVDTSSSLGRGLAVIADAGAEGGATLAFENWRHMVASVNTDAGATRVLHGDSTQPPVSHAQSTSIYGGEHIGAFTFDTPWPSAHCGRVAVLTGHTTKSVVDAGTDFEACNPGDTPMSTDERAAVQLLFNAGACQ